jgi:hypothetical protein
MLLWLVADSVRLIAGACMNRRLVLSLCAFVLLNGCSPQAKPEDKDKLPPQLVDSDSGTNISAGTRAVNSSRAHNETIPVNVNEEYPIHHVVTDVGGKAGGIEITFKTDSGVTEPQSLMAMLAPPNDNTTKGGAPNPVSADFVKASPGVWTATIGDATLGNKWCVDFRVTCKAVKEGNGTSEISVVPAGAAAAQGVVFEDNHSVMGY